MVLEEEEQGGLYTGGVLCRMENHKRTTLRGTGAMVLEEEEQGGLKAIASHCLVEEARGPTVRKWKPLSDIHLVGGTGAMVLEEEEQGRLPTCETSHISQGALEEPGGTLEGGQGRNIGELEVRPVRPLLSHREDLKNRLIHWKGKGLEEPGDTLEGSYVETGSNQNHIGTKGLYVYGGGAISEFSLKGQERNRMKLEVQPARPLLSRKRLEEPGDTLERGNQQEAVDVKTDASGKAHLKDRDIRKTTAKYSERQRYLHYIGERLCRSPRGCLCDPKTEIFAKQRRNTWSGRDIRITSAKDSVDPQGGVCVTPRPRYSQNNGEILGAAEIFALHRRKTCRSPRPRYSQQRRNTRSDRDICIPAGEILCDFPKAEIFATTTHSESGRDICIYSERLCAITPKAEIFGKPGTLNRSTRKRYSQILQRNTRNKEEIFTKQRRNKHSAAAIFATTAKDSANGILGIRKSLSENIKIHHRMEDSSNQEIEIAFSAASEASSSEEESSVLTSSSSSSESESDVEDDSTVDTRKKYKYKMVVYADSQYDEMLSVKAHKDLPPEGLLTPQDELSKAQKKALKKHNAALHNF
eukprot:jgi/Psemu1/3579/gm1.3579_g